MEKMEKQWKEQWRIFATMATMVSAIVSPDGAIEWQAAAQLLDRFDAAAALRRCRPVPMHGHQHHAGLPVGLPPLLRARRRRSADAGAGRPPLNAPLNAPSRFRREQNYVADPRARARARKMLPHGSA